MKSKTSFFNKTIFVSNIKRVWPFWGLLSFCALIPSLVTIVERFRDYEFISLQAMSLKHMYYSFAVYGAPFIAFGTAMVAAMIVWSYLDYSRSVGFYHSIPLTKNGLFITQFLSGLAIMLIPYVIGGALFILTILFLGGGFPLATFTCIGIVIADSFFFFSFATLIAHLTGNILALPALYLVFNFVFIALENLLNFVGSSFLYGLEYNTSTRTGFLSPLYKLLSDVTVITDYADDRYPTGGMRLLSVEIENFHWILIYVAVGVVFTVGSLMIYKKRKSEAAGDVISTKCLKPVIHGIYTITVASLLGLLLYYIFNEGNVDCRVNLFLAIICFNVGLAIAYYTGLMLLEKTIKVFNYKSLRGFIAGFVIVVVLCFCVKYDTFRIERKIPKLNNIDCVDIFSTNDFYLDSKTDGELIKKTLEMHKLIVDNKETLLANLYGLNSEAEYFGGLTLVYHLKDGSSMTRRYTLDIIKDKDKELYEQYKKFMTDKNMTVRVMHNSDDYKLESADVNIYWAHDEKYPSALTYSWEELSDEQLQRVYDAVMKDLEAGTWEPGFSEKESVANFYFSFAKLVRRDESRSYYNYDSLHVDVKTDMTNSLEAIAEILNVPFEEVLRDAKAYEEEIIRLNLEDDYNYTPEYEEYLIDF